MIPAIGPRVIYVVDPFDEERDMYAEYLSAIGYSVSEFPTVEDAITART